MKNLIPIVLLLSIFLLSACQDEQKPEKEFADKPHISQALKEKIEKPTVDTNPKEKKMILESLGISVDDEKIIIDTKQTKDFFHTIGEKLKESAYKIEESLRNERVESSDETGITITETTMHIDLNKTKNFMEKWVKSMESVVEELNRTMSDIEKSFPND